MTTTAIDRAGACTCPRCYLRLQVLHTLGKRAVLRFQSCHLLCHHRHHHHTAARADMWMHVTTHRPSTISTKANLIHAIPRAAPSQMTHLFQRRRVDAGGRAGLQFVHAGRRSLRRLLLLLQLVVQLGHLHSEVVTGLPPGISRRTYTHIHTIN